MNRIGRKDKDAEKWLKQHAHELPPAELPEERAGGKRVLQVAEGMERIPSPIGHPWDNSVGPDRRGGYSIHSDQEEEFYRGLRAESPDKIYDAIDQNVHYWEQRLSKRESEVLGLLRSGLSQAGIARQLGISRAAVTKLCKRIRGIMGRHVDTLFERITCTESELLQSQALSQDTRPRGRKKERSG
jgi:hypothetical protein